MWLGASTEGEVRRGRPENTLGLERAHEVRCRRRRAERSWWSERPGSSIATSSAWHFTPFINRGTPQQASVGRCAPSIIVLIAVRRRARRGRCQSLFSRRTCPGDGTVNPSRWRIMRRQVRVGDAVQRLNHNLKRALETVRLGMVPRHHRPQVRESRERGRGGVGIGTGERSRGRERDCKRAVDSNKAWSIVSRFQRTRGRPRRSIHRGRGAAAACGPRRFPAHLET